MGEALAQSVCASGFNFAIFGLGTNMMLLIPTYIIDSPAHTFPVPVSNYPRAVRRFGSTSCTFMRRACVPQVGVRDHVERGDCVYAVLGVCDVFQLRTRPRPSMPQSVFSLLWSIIFDCSA